MDPVASSAPSGASPPDPPQDHNATTVPNNVAFILQAARTLLTYGRHLIDTMRHRAAAPNFNAIAACFGTAKLSTILDHLNRGLLRAAALERFLVARAATGRDFDLVDPYAPPIATAPAQPAAAPPIARKRAPRLSRPVPWNDAGFFMPTLEELDRQVRRRPIGQAIREICQDLAIVPALCHAPFWNELLEIMHHFHGNMDRLMEQSRDRRRAFAKEQDRKPGGNWDWVEMTREALHQVLGFFIGEPPVNPLDPAAAIAPP